MFKFHQERTVKKSQPTSQSQYQLAPGYYCFEPLTASNEPVPGAQLKINMVNYLTAVRDLMDTQRSLEELQRQNQEGLIYSNSVNYLSCQNYLETKLKQKLLPVNQYKQEICKNINSVNNDYLWQELRQTLLAQQSLIKEPDIETCLPVQVVKDNCCNIINTSMDAFIQAYIDSAGATPSTLSIDFKIELDDTNHVHFVIQDNAFCKFEQFKPIVDSSLPIEQLNSVFFLHKEHQLSSIFALRTSACAYQGKHRNHQDLYVTLKHDQKSGGYINIEQASP